MEKTIELIIIIMLLAIMAEIYLLVKPRRQAGSGTQLPILVDTSVLMDGRVVDLAKTGFLLGQIIVPRSVLIELQLLADGADHAKRERARFGMDAMKELKDVLGGSFTLLDDATRILFKRNWFKFIIFCQMDNFITLKIFNFPILKIIS